MRVAILMMRYLQWHCDCVAESVLSASVTDRRHKRYFGPGIIHIGVALKGEGDGNNAACSLGTGGMSPPVHVLTGKYIKSWQMSFSAPTL